MAYYKVPGSGIVWNEDPQHTPVILIKGPYYWEFSTSSGKIIGRSARQEKEFFSDQDVASFIRFLTMKGYLMVSRSFAQSHRVLAKKLGSGQGSFLDKVKFFELFQASSLEDRALARKLESHQGCSFEEIITMAWKEANGRVVFGKHLQTYHERQRMEDEIREQAECDEPFDSNLVRDGAHDNWADEFDNYSYWSGNPDWDKHGRG